MLKLVAFHNKHRDELTYQLNAEQAMFTVLPETWFDISSADCLRISIIQDDVAIGFLVLDNGTDKAIYSDNPRALLLRSMSINPAYQGKGYAKAALLHTDLQDLIQHHFPNANEVILGVNEKNRLAKRVYQQAGFHDTQRRYQGQLGQQIIMARNIAPFQAA